MNSAKVVHAIERTPDFIAKARKIYRELRELTWHDNRAIASALGVTHTTVMTYRRRAEEGEEPFATVFAEFDAEEKDYMALKMPRLVLNMEKESPSATRKTLFPRLAAETDRAIEGAKMAGWVLAFLEEFQEEMRAEVERVAAEEYGEGDTAEAALDVLYQALDAVVEKHGRDAEAER